MHHVLQKICFFYIVSRILMLLCEGLWVAHVTFQRWCDCIFYFGFMISGTQGGPHSLYHEPHKGVSLLNWLRICNGEFFFPPFSSYNKGLCQSCNKLTIGWHCCRISQVILGENNVSVVNICPLQQKMDTQHSGIEKKMCATELGLVWPHDLFGTTLQVFLSNGNGVC